MLAKHPAIHRTAPQNIELSCQNVSGGKDEKYCSNTHNSARKANENQRPSKFKMY